MESPDSGSLEMLMQVEIFAGGRTSDVCDSIPTTMSAMRGANRDAISAETTKNSRR
jgi:hypothetical protein